MTHSDNPLPDRKKPTHGVKLMEGQPTLVFLTVCTKDRQPWLVSDDVHGLLVDCWINAVAWRVGRYILMPDHLHLFAGLDDSAIPFDNWVRYWKSQFRKASSQPEHRWQTNHWDTRIRSEATYEEKWDYVRDNPVRHRLVERAEDWLYQGELHSLQW